MPYNTFSGLAREVFTVEFNSNTGVASLSQISGWFAANLGGLNNLLNTSFSGVDPEIDEEARNIFKGQYLHSYYNKQMRAALMGVVSSSSDGSNILSVSDGDNRISFVNKNEVAKTYRGLANDLAAQIEKDAHRYTMFMSGPKSVNGLDTEVTGYSAGGYNSFVATDY
jgi:hypothetical protein